MRRRILYLCTSLFVVSCTFQAGDANAPLYPTYDPSLPNPVPASCPQNPVLDPSTLSAELRALTPYWIGNAMLTVGHVGSPIWHSGENKVWWRAGEQPLVELRLLEGRSAPPSVQWTESRGNLFGSSVVLPASGCWEFLASVQSQTVRLLVYAYAARYVP